MTSLFDDRTRAVGRKFDHDSSPVDRVEEALATREFNGDRTIWVERETGRARDVVCENVPVLRCVNRAATLPVWISTTSTLGLGGNVFAMYLFAGNSRRGGIRHSSLSGTRAGCGGRSDSKGASSRTLKDVHPLSRTRAMSTTSAAYSVSFSLSSLPSRR